MTIHAPIYHKQNPELRVACRSNGLWQAQSLDNEVQGNKTDDPWQGLHRWTTKAAAIAKMHQVQPEN